MAKKFLKVFDLRAWYILHIILLIVWTVLLGNWILDFTRLSLTTLYPLRIFSTIVVYSILAYIFDTLFHSLTGLD